MARHARVGAGTDRRRWSIIASVSVPVDEQQRALLENRPRIDVRLSYLICAIPRSGSYLLCESLRNTTVAGRPTEYLSSGFRDYWSPRWGTPTLDGYLERVVESGTTPNGVFGCKSHAGQFDYFARQVSGRMPVPHRERPKLLARWFPNLHYVRLRRADRVRQAVSYVKAIQSNIWWDADHPPAPYDVPRPDSVRFDYLLIERSMARLDEEDQRWTRYFDAIGVNPLTLDFDDIVTDVDGAVRSVLDHLGLEPPEGYRAPPSGFRRQADEHSDQWVDRFLELRRRPRTVAVDLSKTVGASTAPAEHRTSWLQPPPDWLAPQVPPSTGPASDPPRRPEIDPDGSLRRVLGPGTWWLADRPFPYLRATNVLTPAAYAEVTEHFRLLEASGRFTRGIPGYDVTAMSLTPDTAGPFEVFLSRAWNDALAGMFGVDVTGDVNVSLHRHEIGSTSGKPHNDLNPGWFPREAATDGITVSDARTCEYRTGRAPEGIATVERVRAVAVIYHLGNSEVPPVGGDTGLYRSASDNLLRPLVLIPPVNNSLVAFECTPYSFHAFITNRTTVRNSLVMWLHRTKEDVIERFGEANIVGW